MYPEKMPPAEYAEPTNRNGNEVDGLVNQIIENITGALLENNLSAERQHIILLELRRRLVEDWSRQRVDSERERYDRVELEKRLSEMIHEQETT